MSGSTVMIAVDSAGTGLERLRLDGTQSLTVSDATAQTSLLNIETNTSGLATEATLASVATEATLGLVATESTLSAVSTTLSNTDAKVPSLGSALSSASTPVVIASDQSAVPVSLSSSSASATTVFNAQSVTSGSTANSTSVDLNTVRDGISVFGNFGDTTAQILVGMSADNSTWYISDSFHYVDGVTGDFGFTLPSFGARYIRLTVVNNDVASQTITAIISTK